MIALYKTLVLRFHPDRCREHYALERTKQINANKDNESALRRLAISWGVIQPTTEDTRFQSQNRSYDAQRVRQEAAEARFREAVRQANENARQSEAAARRVEAELFARLERERILRETRRASASISKAEQVARAFVRCGIKPRTKYYGLGIRLLATGRGYITVERTAGEFVFYTDLRGKEQRVSITKCRP